MESILIRKYDGALVPFKRERLLNSLVRSGASNRIADQITRIIELELTNGMPTKSIYRKASKLLQKHQKGAGVKYRLKQAILELGPSGYPFEKFVAELFKQRGFSVEVGVMMQGFSVRHEVDVVAQNSDKYYVIECKFHNNQATKTDVKVPMYIHSRVNDLYKILKRNEARNKNQYIGWIVTNTRFTADAIKFGKDYGLALLGWDYPTTGGLRDWIQLEGLHPVTALASLTKKEKRHLIEQGVVRCKQLYEQPNLLDDPDIRIRNKKGALKELKDLFE